MRTWLLVAALCVSLSSRLTAAEIMASHIPDAPVSFRILSSVSGNCWPSASSAQSAGELILRQSGIELRSKIEHYHISLEFLAFGGRADNSENCLVGWHFTATSFDSTNRYGLAKLLLFEGSGISTSANNTEKHLRDALEDYMKSFANEYLKMRESGRVK